MKILLVDDKSENIYLLEKMLQGNGYKTLSAANGAEALEVALKKKPDLVISDILMPVMDGFTLCREWRKNEILRKIPFIFYTATYTDPKDNEFAISIGADRFVIKPQAMNDFLEIIRDTFNKCKAKEAFPIPKRAPEEKVFLKEYNETLIRKLEDKTTELEAAEKELREKNDSLEKDIEERKRTEEKILESEEKFRNLFENSSTGISMTGIDGSIKVNKAFCNMVGYSEKELKNKKWMDITHPEDIRLTNDLIRSLLDGKISQARFEKRFISKKGNIVWTDLSSYLQRDKDGKPQYLITTITDITERKQADEKFASAFRLSPSSMTISTKHDGRFIDVNDSFLKELGYQRDEVIGRTSSEINFWVDLAHRDRMIKKLNNCDKISDFEFQFRDKQGGIHCGLASVTIINIADDPCVLTQILDITKRKEAEEALKQTNEILLQQKKELAILNEINSVANRAKDLSTLLKDVLEELLQLLDFDAGGVYMIDPDGCNAHVVYSCNVPPEFLDKVSVVSTNDDRYSDLFKNGIPIFTDHYEKISPKNAYKTGFRSLISVPLYSKTCIIGAFNLISKKRYVVSEEEKNILISIGWEMGTIIGRIKAEEEIRASEELFSTVFNSSAVTFSIARLKDGHFLNVSDTWQNLFGYSKEEAIGRSVLDLNIISDVNDENQMRKMLNDQGVVQGYELRIRRKSGEIVNIIMSSNLIKMAGETCVLTIALDTSEHKRMEEELRSSELFLNSIISQSPYPIWISDHKGTLIKINGACLKLLHIAEDDLIGKYNVLEDNLVREQGYLPLVKSVFSDGTIAKFELKYDTSRLEFIKLQHTKCLILEVTIFPVRDANGKITNAVIQHLDITERKRAEEALQDSEEKFRSIFEHNSSALVIMEADTTISMVNDAYCQMTGYSKEEIIGTSWAKQMPPEDIKRLKEYTRRRLHNPQDVPDKYEFRFYKKNGEIRYGLMSVSLIKSTKKIATSFLDITEQKTLQQELLQSQKMQSIGTLAGGIAHDFNNILGIILGYSTLIERTSMSNEKLHESLGVINSAVDRGASLVRQILTFARKTDIVFAPMSLSDLIHELLSMLRQTFSKMIVFTEIIDKDIPFLIADRTQVHQAILNLCVNARDAMPKGGSITIKVIKQTKEQVQDRFSGADQDMYVLISVADTGDGMDEATCRQIFDPFFTTKEKGKGTGLGLAVVYGVVQSHHGFIDVESAIGHGTTFKIYLPLPLENGMITHVTATAEPFGIGGNETILFIEDEEALSEMVSLLLESKGYKVYTTRDGKEAVGTFRDHKKEIDLVLSDMGLPGISGMDVFKILKKIDPNISAIFASGYFEPDVKAELTTLGAKGFIQKPYSPDEILRKLREEFDKKKE